MNELINIIEKDGQLVVSSRQVAEDFEKEHRNITRDIEALKKDVLNFEQMFIQSTYEDSYGRKQKEYLLNRDGFSLLVMGFTGKAALDWKLKYIDAFNRMERTLTEKMEGLSPLLRELIEIEQRQNRQEKAIAETNARLDSIKDTITLNTQGWREECRKLIARIARAWGGNGFIGDVNSEIYKLVDERAGVSLATRRTNKRQRMALEGASRTKRDRITFVDIIAEDKKLIEIYTAIVKEMAVKYLDERAI